MGVTCRVLLVQLDLCHGSFTVMQIVPLPSAEATNNGGQDDLQAAMQQMQGSMQQMQDSMQLMQVQFQLQEEQNKVGVWSAYAFLREHRARKSPHPTHTLSIDVRLLCTAFGFFTVAALDPGML